MSPMVDGWMGDDWFHNGAFRETMLDYFPRRPARRATGRASPWVGRMPTRRSSMRAPRGDFARKYGLDQLPALRKIMEHPSYDAWWQGQALDKLLGARPLKVPTMLVVGQWDQEDSYGTPAVYRALEPKDTKNDKLSIVIGPWRHSGVNYDGSALGPLRFAGDTGLQFRRDVMKPFLDKYLRDARSPATPPALTYATGLDQWQESDKWPNGTPTPLYLGDNMALSFDKPLREGADDYVSDPARPVPFAPRPFHTRDGSDAWRTWLVTDQRFVDSRPDVLTYVTPPLDHGVHIMGAPQVDLFAATSGTDSDWVVKVIDVYPEEMSSDPKMAGYELPIGIDIFRGRYVSGFDKPAALTPGKTSAIASRCRT